MLPPAPARTRAQRSPEQPWLPSSSPPRRRCLWSWELQGPPARGRLADRKFITLLGWRGARGDPNSGEHGEETDNQVDPDRFAQGERAHGRGEHGIDRRGDGGSRRRRALKRKHPEEKGG